MTIGAFVTAVICLALTAAAVATDEYSLLVVVLGVIMLAAWIDMAATNYDHAERLP